MRSLFRRHRWLARAAVLFAVVLAFWLAATVYGQRAHANWTWQPAASGMSWGTVMRRASSGSVRVTAVRAEPSQWGLHVLDARRVAAAGSTASQICPDGGAAINAGYFAADRSPIGWVVAGGRTLSPPYRGTTGYGGWWLVLVRGGRTTFAPLGSAAPTSVDEAVQCVPLLLKDGTVQPLKQTPPAPRAAAGLDQEGRVVLAVADGSVTLQEWATCLRDDLGCREALNLDGGPSAQLAVRGTVRRTTASTAAVPIFLALTPRRTPR